MCDSNGSTTFKTKVDLGPEESKCVVTGKLCDRRMREHSIVNNF
jgi:hypothetical protein